MKHNFKRDRQCLLDARKKKSYHKYQREVLATQNDSFFTTKLELNGIMSTGRTADSFLDKVAGVVEPLIHTRSLMLPTG